MNVTCVVGARPNFVKAAPVVRELAARDVDVRLVNTGQHYDHFLSSSFLQVLDMPVPDANLEVGSGSHGRQTADILLGVEFDLLENPVDAVIVFGDVNSTLGATLAAAKLGIPVVHVESGLRSGDRLMPEEVNRILVDHASDLLLCTAVEALDHLADEGLSRRAKLVGNTMIDSLFHVLPQAEDCAVDNGFILVTLHRPELVDNLEQLEAVIKVLQTAPLDVVFPVHPRTKKMLGDTSGIIMTGPQDYRAFVSLMVSAKLVVTDSGGVQEETSALGVPCLTFRSNTERYVTCQLGTNRLVGTRPEALAEAILDTLERPHHMSVPIPHWDGHAGERAADEIVAWLS